MMITARNISVAFGRGFFRPRIKALDSFSLTVQEGDIFALLGRRPEPGSALFREIAYLPEEPHYHLYLTVEEAVMYYARLLGNGANKQQVNRAIERVGMAEFRDRRLSKCSKGMKQKAGIAACLVNKPRLVFLDEPTRGLDPIMVKEFRDILVEMNKDGTTIVLNSHVLSEIEMICNRAAIMDRGKVIAQDEMNRLRGAGLETYQVEFDLMDPPPPSVRVTIKTPTTIKGEVPAESLQEFVQQVDGSGKRIYECSLKRLSLEDSFFNILSGKNKLDADKIGKSG